jgi:hypothetical protein
MNKNNHSIFKAGKIGFLMVIIAVSVVTAMMYLQQVAEPMIQTTIQSAPRSWKPVGYANPGTGKGGFLCYGTYPHQVAPAVAYASNLSNATMYEFTDNPLGGELTGETPYTVLHDHVLTFRVNATQGYNTSGARWEDSWVQANLTLNFDFLADVPKTAMTIVQIANNSVYAWYNAYLNNGGAGYQLSKNEKFAYTTDASAYY